MLSDTDSSDDELLMPNGFIDVAADSVQLDFDIKSSGTSPPRNKKKGGKKDRSVSCDSFHTTTNLDVDSAQPSPIIIPDVPDPLHALDESCEFIESSEETSYGRRLRSSKRKRSCIPDTPQPLSRNRYKKTVLTSDLNDSGSIVLSPDASPKTHLDLSTCDQTSFSFDVDDDVLEEIVAKPNNESDELQIRVLWKGVDRHTFTLRKYQKMKEIFEHYAELEEVEEGRILLTLRDKPVFPNDTPETLKIGIGILEGGVTDAARVPSGTTQNVDYQPPEDPNALRIFVQRRNVKEKHTVYIRPHEKISVLMSKLSEDLGIPYASIKLIFDGQQLQPNDTPESCEIDVDECIDLIEKT